MEVVSVIAAGAVLPDVIDNLMVFVLSSFLGLGLILHVSRLLHTPLMSLTNAISSVAMVAALLVLAADRTNSLIIVMAVVAVACSAINAVGGFLITDRILKMFRRS